MKLRRFALLLCILPITLYALEDDETYIQKLWSKDEYSKNAQLQSRWADKFFFTQYQFNGNENVLDIGSGDGKITAHIATALPKGKVVGIDKSKDLIDQATKEFGGKPNLVFVLEDANNQNFYLQHENEFDLVVSFSTLHWVKDQDAALAGINKVLKPNGTFYLKLCSKGYDPIQLIADNLAATPKYKPYFKNFVDPISRFTIKEYESLLQKANLQVLSIKDSEEKDKIQSKENLIKQIKSWLPHYHYLKRNHPDKAEPYLKEIIDAYIKKHPVQPDGSITLYDHYLEVVGKKP